MKRLTLILFMIVAFGNLSIAQNKVTKYCVLTGYTESLFGAGLKINFGKADSLFSFKNSSVKEKLEKVALFKTIPDALNYMSSIGWTLVEIVNDNDRSFLRIYFKKEFDRSALSKE